jgi:tetratricopeptide (TPR) repeat protein
MTVRSVFSFGVGACIVLALLRPAVADTVGDCKWASDDPRAVIDACTTLISGGGAASWMYFNRGLAFKMRGQLTEAHSDYTKAIEYDPSFGAAYTNRGNVRALSNDLAGALADFRKALKLDPKDHVALQNLKAIQAALRKVGADKSGKGVTTVPAR